MTTYYTWEGTNENGVINEHYSGHDGDKELSRQEALQGWEVCDDQWANCGFAYLEDLSPDSDYYPTALENFNKCVNALPFTRKKEVLGDGDYCKITYTMKKADVETKSP